MNRLINTNVTVNKNPKKLKSQYPCIHDHLETDYGERNHKDNIEALKRRSMV